MASPEDAIDVINAIRLGWVVAEVRGRNRPDAPLGWTQQVPPNDSHALPLHLERDKTELRIEAQTVLAELSSELKVDTSTTGSYGKRIGAAAKALAYARKKTPEPVGADPNQIWQELSTLLWHFDAHVQDSLAATSVTQASGYQLGRGLAESYWALDPAKADGWNGWTLLLGNARCNEFERLVGRLSAYMPEYTPAAVAGSIEVWKKVAEDPEWRGDAAIASAEGHGDTSTPDVKWRADAPRALYRQLQRWYDLVVVGQDPTTLVAPGQVMRNFRTIGRAIKFFWLQALVLIGSAGALGTLAYLLSSGSSSAGGKIATGILGAVGLSFASVTGYLKNSAQAMLTRLRQDAYTDLIAAAVQTAPSRRTSGRSHQSWKVHEAISARSLTTSVPN